MIKVLIAAILGGFLASLSTSLRKGRHLLIRQPVNWRRLRMVILASGGTLVGCGGGQAHLPIEAYRGPEASLACPAVSTLPYLKLINPTNGAINVDPAIGSVTIANTNPAFVPANIRIVLLDSSDINIVSGPLQAIAGHANQFTAAFPKLSPGTFYNVEIKYNGSVCRPAEAVQSSFETAG